MSLILLSNLSSYISPNLSHNLSINISPNLSFNMSPNISSNISPNLTTNRSPNMSTNISPCLCRNLSNNLSFNLSQKVSSKWPAVCPEYLLQNILKYVPPVPWSPLSLTPSAFCPLSKMSWFTHKLPSCPWFVLGVVLHFVLSFFAIGPLVICIIILCLANY